MFGCVSRPSVDFTAHLNFTPHLRATLEGLNITNQRIVQYTDIPSHRIEVKHLERPHHPVGHDLRVWKWGGGRGCEPRRRFTYHPVMIGSAWVHPPTTQAGTRRPVDLPAVRGRQCCDLCPLGEVLPAEVELIALQPPGRGSRNERSTSCADAAARRGADERVCGNHRAALCAFRTQSG